MSGDTRRKGSMGLHLHGGGEAGPFHVLKLTYIAVRMQLTNTHDAIEFHVDGTEYSFRGEDILYLTWKDDSGNEPA